MGHVCDPAKAAARIAEALAIASSGVSNDMDLEEAIARLAQSQATVQGRVRESAPEPSRTLGLTFFEWRVVWMVATWGVLLFAGGLILGALFREHVLK